ncbi:MAG: ferredoxin family protein [Alistipes sp.]|nr:ferredoxin family protein [Alistipes sp.]
MSQQNIVICACASRSFISKVQVAELVATLQQAGYNVTIEADLCETAETDPARMRELVAGNIIMGCYTRALRALADRADCAAAKNINIRGRRVEQVLKELNLDDAMDHDEEWQARRDAALAEINAFAVKVATDAWYPILDYERCVDCGKCHDFCLFGVYSIEDGKVKVAQPQNCKNNCPACSRVCPAEAVIFPKYERSPINGGSASEEGVIMLDMDTMYADALRARLEQRRASVMLFKDKK